MESRKLLLIINPVSGRLKIGASLLDILKVFSDAGYIVTVQTTRAKGDATRLVRELGPGHDLVVLSGGDGTLNEGVEGLMEGGLDIPVGYIPCGTTNDFAASLGIERENLRQAAENIVNGKVNIIDVGLFGRNRYFSYIASFGAFTGTSYSVPQTTKNVLGHLAYVLEGVKEVPNIRPINATVSINGEIIEEDSFIFGSVSNATSIG
ncbi:MAG: YegS/Rv2252/BmrU family lipid kinase, partial [Clostridia bacterium]|nr:YegS/Rv2252/BmrU family lipid kinase [Clostridia bacterium]